VATGTSSKLFGRVFGSTTLATLEIIAEVVSLHNDRVVFAGAFVEGFVAQRESPPAPWGPCSQTRRGIPDEETSTTIRPPHFGQ
jgi:hypothetical protein